MEKEIAVGTMLGIVLIALAAVIGLGFGIFAIAKGVGNEGQMQVSETLNTVNEFTFTDFDQQVVMGNRIFAFYEEVKGKPVAILINSKSINSGAPTSLNSITYTQTIDGKNYLNYNALLANDNEGIKENLQKQSGGVSVQTSSVTDAIVEKDGVMKAKYSFTVNKETGKVEFNTGISGWYSEGNCEYINSNGKYNAVLIRDAANRVVGVAFSQVE